MQNILKPGYESQLFFITALTNTHVGSGKNNYGIIDNQVQRAPLTNQPVINASSLKGALRQYCYDSWGKEDKRITYIFGSDTKETEASQGGSYIFFQGNLLSIPVRSDAIPFFRATCPRIIQELLDTLKDFSIDSGKKELLSTFMSCHNGEAVHFNKSLESQVVTVEALDLQASYQPLDQIAEIEKIFGENLVLVADSRFDELVADENLPIIARNNLENGISQNLWYEQVLPRQTRFFTLLLYPPQDNHIKEFSTHLQERPVQIGANASIGYGFCNLKKAAL